MTLDEIAQGLERFGFAVIPDFAERSLWQTLTKEAESLRSHGAFRAARIGREKETSLHTDIRSDSIFWLDPLILTPAQAQAWSLLDTLKSYLNHQFYLGLRWFECHFAIYPAGAAYAKHLDRFQDNSARTVSFVLYLNDAWQTHEGGALRLFDRERPDTLIKEIPPIGGTLACFMSGEIPHEVLSPSRPRYSLTGWFRTDLPP